MLWAFTEGLNLAPCNNHVLSSLLVLFNIFWQIFVVHSSPGVHPCVIAAHPFEPNQFAIGLSDGAVQVVEPLEAEGKWGLTPLAENGSTSSTNSTAVTMAGPNQSSEQASR
jgi:hypothetical protein